MTELQRYLAEEVAEDHADGQDPAAAAAAYRRMLAWFGTHVASA